MCFGPGSSPPIMPATDSSIDGSDIRLDAADGTQFAAFRADASQARGVGIIVLPDYYGLTPYYKQLAACFAGIDLDAIGLDYYGRTARDSERDASFDHLSHMKRTTWAGLRSDAEAAAAELRTRRGVTSLFSIGFCFGGRLSFLLGTVPGLDMSGVIGFYGWPVGPFTNDTPAPAEVVEHITAPLLGLFGGADAKIPTAHVAEFERALATAAVESRIVTYEGAGHSFFDRNQANLGEAKRSPAGLPPGRIAAPTFRTRPRPSLQMSAWSALDTCRARWGPVCESD